jgi:hypothetical protein
MKPAIFNTITGADWKRAMPMARTRRATSHSRMLAQIHNHSSGTSPETRRPSNAPRERCERSAG